MKNADANNGITTAKPSTTPSPFIRKAEGFVEANLENEQFGVEDLARHMGISRSQLHRKFQKLIGKSISQFIREYRLKVAMERLKQQDKTAAEIAFEVGFNSPSYFTKCFMEYFGITPGDVRRMRESPPLKGGNEIQAGREDQVPRLNKKLVLGIAMAFLVAVIVVIWLLPRATAMPDELTNPIADSGIKSVAVIPFANLNAGEEDEYISAGIVAAVNRHLAQVEDMRIVSVASSDIYQNTSKSVAEIGQELSVAYLLEGSFQRQEEMIRLEVRLVDAETASLVWAKNYDREMKDIFATQSDIATQIAIALKASLSPGEQEEINRQATKNADAYDLYLRGVYEYRTYTHHGNRMAIECFKRAVALDSTYAQAYAGLANSYIAQASIFSVELGALEAMEKAKPYLVKALELDPNLPEAHTWYAFYLLYNNWDFEGAEQEYRKAIASNYPDALALFADFLHFTGRFDEALEISRKLNTISPFYPNQRLILSFYFNELYEEAEEYALSRLKLYKNYFTYDNYGFLLLNIGRYSEAIEIFKELMTIEGIRYPRILGWMGAAYAHSGQEEKSREIIEELLQRQKRTNAGSNAFFLAVIHSALGEKQLALKWLEQSCDEHEMELPWLYIEPQFNPLKGHPRFKELLRKVGFPLVE